MSAFAPAKQVTELWSDPELQPAFARFQALESWIRQMQMEVTAVAAPTMREGLRAEWLLKQMQHLGLRADVDAAGNVVAVRPASNGNGQVGMQHGIAITAHMDTAFAPGTEVAPQCRDGLIHAPGIGDNGAGLAALLALARVLQEQRIATRRPVFFVANVGEEGEGDLKGMRYLFERSPWKDQIAWTLVLDGPGHDQITAQALGSRRIKLTFNGPGGHSWSDAGRASAIHAALRTGAALLSQVENRPSEAIVNVGMVQGGSSVNAIAAEAFLKIDLRAIDSVKLERLTQAVRRAAAAGAEQENDDAGEGRVEVRLEIIGERPAGELAANSSLMRAVRAADATLGIASRLQCASTDANLPLALGLQALRLGAGGRGGGAHTLQEWYDPTGRELALKRALLIVLAMTRAEGDTSAELPAAAGRLPGARPAARPETRRGRAK